MLDEIAASWPAVPAHGPLPDPATVGLQLFVLAGLHTGLTHTALRPLDAFAAPEQAAAARRERRATTRAVSMTTVALQRISEVLELADTHQLAPTPLACQHAQWLYQEAAQTLSTAARDLRANGPAPRSAANPTRPAAAEADRPSRGAAARLRSALTRAFRSGPEAARPGHHPSTTAPSTAKRL
ncbi:hypothetical protein ABTX81_01805 [Kitasatospora sp. NPDC097605]|uniref:hypothetical protein n=1 Tax=Kitasatospora sp. NPDC097605 TaxID=3157226 RepID=UPI0033257458